MLRLISKKWILLYFFVFFVLIGCSGSKKPNPDIVLNGSGDIYELELLVNEQQQKIKSIENELAKYKNIIDDQEKVINIFHENNNKIIDFRNKLERESKAILDEFNNSSFEKEMTNTLIKVQNKIQILEDRTFYTDSLYFEIVNELVMMENKIEALIASYKEMTELSGKKKKRVVPKITNEEYQAKYIEALSNYQNADWNLSLDGFRFLIQSDRNHELADNCQYWIGEVYYAIKDFKRSIKEFEKVFAFPGTNKADDAQFKLGLCYVNLGQIKDAKLEFEDLLESYPNSEYYKRSQEYLQKY